MLEHEKPERRADMEAPELSDWDIAVICIAQEDLPLVERPFAVQAAAIGVTEDELLATLQSFIDRKLMRRFAAVMNHRSAGFKANAMGVWAVPEDQLEEIGPQMAGFAAVSHCYRRPTYEDWPYTVFTMVHGRTGKDCEATIDAIRDETGVDEYTLLWSIKEYKKVRLRYYAPEWDEWRAEHLTPDRLGAVGGDGASAARRRSSRRQPGRDAGGGDARRRSRSCAATGSRDGGRASTVSRIVSSLVWLGAHPSACSRSDATTHGNTRYGTTAGGTSPTPLDHIRASTRRRTSAGQRRERRPRDERVERLGARASRRPRRSAPRDGPRARRASARARRRRRGRPGSAASRHAHGAESGR